MTAKHYAEYAARAGQLATAIQPAIQPEDATPIAQTAALAVFHLRMAARELLRAAEWLAEHEDVKKDATL